MKERRLSWGRKLCEETGALSSRMSEWRGAYPKERRLVEVWENGELDLRWESSIFSWESPCRRLHWSRRQLGQKTMHLD